MMKIKLNEDQWTRISYEDINSKPSIDQKTGAIYMIAPSDVPKELKLTRIDDTSNHKTSLTIEFRYLSESEPLKQIELDHKSKLRIVFGSKSRRVYTIKMEVSTPYLNQLIESNKKDSVNIQQSFFDKLLEKIRQFGIRNFDTLSKLKEVYI